MKLQGWIFAPTSSLWDLLTSRDYVRQPFSDTLLEGV